MMDEIDRAISRYRKARRTIRAAGHEQMVAERQRRIQASWVAHGRNPCEFIATRPQNSNQVLLNVRCYCMAERGWKKNHLNYDTLGQADSLQEAIQMWREHVEQRQQEEEVQKVGTDTDDPTLGRQDPHHHTAVHPVA